VASFDKAFIDCSPGNVVTLTGAGLAGASAMLGNQGADVPGAIAIPTTINDAGTTLTFTVPDGATTGLLIASVGASSPVATCELVVSAQYLQQSQFAAEAEGVADAASKLAPSTILDLLRDASALIDSTVGTTLRLLQVVEEHAYRPPRNGQRARVWPLRGPLRSMPLVSVDALNGIGYGATFGTTGPLRRLNATEGYVDVGPHSLFFIPESWRIVYTAGYGWKETPRAVRKATAIIASAMMVEAGLIEIVGGMASVREGDVAYTRGSAVDIAIPPRARAFLTPWRGGGIR
jgi:hypothetical protein